MMKKRNWLIGGLAAVVLCAAGLVYFAIPVPVVRNAAQAEILFIRYNCNGADDLVLIDEGFDQEAILAYLSTCKERRTIHTMLNYMMGDVELHIWLKDGEKVKNVMLGNLNYSYRDTGSLKHEILNPEQVKADLREILKLDSGFNPCEKAKEET
jgi:hypothetical protein